MGEITRGALIFTAAAGATGVGIGVLAQEYGPKEPPEKVAAYAIPRIDGAIPLSADDEVWKDADRRKVAVTPQQVAPPFLEQPTLAEMEMSAVYNDRELGVLVKFACHEPQDLPGLNSFGDAVAMQLPLAGTATPPITMGGPGQPVHVLRWTAVWQRDVDRGRSSVETIFPNTVRDVSPESVLPPESAELYSPGRAVGNPMAALERKWPVEEGFAEGFGSLTPLAKQQARAAGRHKDGHWSVVIAAPLDRRPDGDLLSDRTDLPIAFALWIGSAGNRGSRKHYSDWVQCKLA
jgi:hypothetical protein